MNRIRRTATRLVALFVIAASSSLALAEDPKTPIALKGLDPISLVDGKEIAGLDAFATVRGGNRYLFTDSAHKAAFEKDPSRYALREGGGCTVMPGAPASANVFSAYKGRIYYFASEHCRDGFIESPAEFLKARKKVAIFVFDGVELLDFAGPAEVFASAGDGRDFEVFLVAPKAGPIMSQGFVKVTPEYTLADCPKPDIIVLPGGAGTSRAVGDPAVIDWIKASSKDAEATLSVCTGAFLLGKAGLLDGLEATTHHGSIAGLRRMYPGTKVVEGRRFVDNGKIVTSAGVSAGIDAALHVVDRLEGREVAKAAAHRMEYRWEPENPARP